MNRHPAADRDRYSANVRLRLHVNGCAIPLSQIAPEFVMPAEPVDLPPGPAEIVMTIDGRERRWPVYLPDGAVTTSDRIRSAPRDFTD